LDISHQQDTLRAHVNLCAALITAVDGRCIPVL
jgi:hypothetical protein